MTETSPPDSSRQQTAFADSSQDTRRAFKEQSLRLIATHLVPMTTERETSFTNRFWVKGENDNQPYFKPDESLSKTTLPELGDLYDQDGSIDHKIIDAIQVAEKDFSQWYNSSSGIEPSKSLPVQMRQPRVVQKRDEESKSLNPKIVRHSCLAKQDRLTRLAALNQLPVPINSHNSLRLQTQMSKENYQTTFKKRWISESPVKAYILNKKTLDKRVEENKLQLRFRSSSCKVGNCERETRELGVNFQFNPSSFTKPPMTSYVLSSSKISNKVQHFDNLIMRGEPMNPRSRSKSPELIKSYMSDLISSLFARSSSLNDGLKTRIPIKHGSSLYKRRTIIGAQRETASPNPLQITFKKESSSSIQALIEKLKPFLGCAMKETDYNRVFLDMKRNDRENKLLLRKISPYRLDSLGQSDDLVKSLLKALPLILSVLLIMLVLSNLVLFFQLI